MPRQQLSQPDSYRGFYEMIAFASISVFLVFLAVVILGLQSVPLTEQRRRLSAQLARWPLNSQVAFTGNTTSASATVASVSSLTGLEVGMTVTGAGIPAATTIITITNSGGDSITLSGNATATATGVALTAAWATGTAQIHLYSSAYGGGADPTPASFTEADFDTYTDLTVTTLAGPYSNPDGSAEVDVGLFSWVLTTTPTVGNLIYGYWIDYVPVGGGSTRVVACWENLPTPLSMNAAGNAVVLTVPIKLPTPGTVSIP